MGDRRSRALELIAERPQASLREVARLSGISVGTAHSIRRQFLAAQEETLAVGFMPRQEESGALPHPNDRPLPSKQNGKQRRIVEAIKRDDIENTLSKLARDPALRTDSGRKLLHWLQRHAISQDEWLGYVEALPPHWCWQIAAMAREIAQKWNEFADMIDQRWPVESGLSGEVLPHFFLSRMRGR